MLLPGLAFAQTGKIVGVVLDNETGEPIIGANIVVEGTSRGAATGLDGDFVIVAMQPGTYQVKASAVGYSAVTMADVVISIDLTSNLEFKLSSSAIQMEEVVIVYKKPVVDIGVSSKVERYDAGDLKMMASDDVNDALITTPGFKIDDEGKIHIRGGRDTEARFMVDGIDTRDPITGESLPLNLSSVNIQEIQILTGGMSAEYGQAMSGFVTITTPEGAPDSYNGTVMWQTDMFSDEWSFDEDQVDAALGGPLPFTKGLIGKNPITFYLTFNGNVTNTHAYLGGDYENEDYIGSGIDLPRRQYNDWGGSAKFALDLGRGKKLSAYFSERTVVQDARAWLYNYNIENVPEFFDKRSSFIVDFTNQVSEKTVITMSVGRRVINTRQEPRGKEPDEFTLEEEIESGTRNAAIANDINGNGRWDQDVDGDGVVHSDSDELSFDQDQNNFLDGYYDANGSGVFEGGNEGYEDLNLNGRWDRGEDWIDLDGDGVYDYAEAWTDRTDPVTGQNNIGVWDPWDPFVDANGNGVWDPAEPQASEQDINGNGRWDGERFQDANGDGVFDRWESFVDANGNGVWDWTDINGNGRWDNGEGESFQDINGNGVQDDGEGYDDSNLSGDIDLPDLVDNLNEDIPEPFYDGDIYFDTGEPFTDLPDPIDGSLNGTWDPGEPYVDLPTSNFGFGAFQFGVPTLNGQYDGPNGTFDEYELFTYFTGDQHSPVGYTYDASLHGEDWLNTPRLANGIQGYYGYNSLHSTWNNRTLDDINPNDVSDRSTWVFDPPNGAYDREKEQYVDYNGNGVWNTQDLFLNPGTWDDGAVWSKSRTEEYSFKASWQSQVHKFHEMKAGTELKYYIMSQKYIEQPDQIYTGAAETGTSEIYPGIGSVRDFWKYEPIEGAFYVKDKMEFEGLIVDAGLRTDFVIHDQGVVDEQQRRFDAGEPGAVQARKSRTQVAPRLGISHPITERSKLYFNYGHFYQLPSFTYFYKATTTNVNEGTVGNPNLKYEKTVTYELGVHNQLTDNLSIQVAGYYRDLYDQISTVEIVDSGVTIYRYINLDYGRMRGFEMKIDRSFADHYQFSFNYDFSYAYGKSSGVLDEFENRASNVPVNYDEYPLDWDETHRVTLNTAVSYRKGDYPVLFGFRLPDYWLLSVQWQFGSGRPYTPSQYTTGMDPNLILENSERMPWTETTNFRFEKYFDVGDSRWIFGLQVHNVWDKFNVNRLYEETGSPDIAIHPENPAYNPFTDRAQYDLNPWNYSSGRQIMFKVGVEF